MSEELGKAVLTISHPDLRGGFSIDEYVESAEHPDPFRTCENIWNSVKDDWPGAIHSIAVNDRGRLLMRNTRMREIGFDGPNHPEYAEKSWT